MIKNEMPVEVMELSPRAINGLLSNKKNSSTADAALIARYGK